MMMMMMMIIVGERVTKIPVTYFFGGDVMFNRVYM
jgi:hypothetical protein